MATSMEHCTRPWWKRPPVWSIGILAVLALIAAVVYEMTGNAAPMPYGAFLDQLVAGNVASVTFQGTEIDGRLKQPLVSARSIGTAPQEAFRSRVPDFGDPSLIPELRKQGVTIDVKSASQWLLLLGRVPWPIMIILGVMIVAGLVRLARGGKVQPASVMSMHPMGGMIGMVSGLFARPKAEDQPVPGSGEPKTR